MNVANYDVRLQMMKNRIKQYELARHMKISESYLSRLLRDDLNEKNKVKIQKAIKEMSHEK